MQFLLRFFALAKKKPASPAGFNAQTFKAY